MTSCNACGRDDIESPIGHAFLCGVQMGQKLAGIQTAMQLDQTEPWPLRPSLDEPKLGRIGWIDQKGRVWTSIPAVSDFDGGSLVPLLVQLDD